MSTNSSKKQMTKKTFFLDENINMCVEEAMQKAKKGLKEKPDEMALGYICFNFVAAMSATPALRPETWH